MALTDKLSAIGNAIREKTGGTAKLTLDQMPSAIASISGGGGTTNYYDAYVYTGRVSTISKPTTMTFTLNSNHDFKMGNDNWKLIFGVISYNNHYIYRLSSKGLELMINKSSTPFKGSSVPVNLFDAEGTLLEQTISDNNVNLTNSDISYISMGSTSVVVNLNTGNVSSIVPPIAVFYD